MKRYSLIKKVITTMSAAVLVFSCGMTAFAAEANLNTDGEQKDIGVYLLQPRQGLYTQPAGTATREVPGVGAGAAGSLTGAAELFRFWVFPDCTFLDISNPHIPAGAKLY